MFCDSPLLSSEWLLLINDFLSFRKRVWKIIYFADASTKAVVPSTVTPLQLAVITKALKDFKTSKGVTVKLIAVPKEMVSYTALFKVNFKTLLFKDDFAKFTVGIKASWQKQGLCKCLLCV
jgi:hypothetical protein